MSELEPLPEPTKRQLHGYKYSPKEQAEKDMVIKAMLRDFPNTPGGELMCEWVYDFVKQTPPEELDRMIESGELDRESKFSTRANKKLAEQYNGTRDLESQPLH